MQFLGAGRRELSLIGLVRRRDPYTGREWSGLDVVSLVQSYDDADAAAIAVTTEPEFHGGRTSDLELAAATTTAPLLRDDFTLHPSQVHQSRILGADAVVIPVEWLNEDEVADLVRTASSLHMASVLAVFATDGISRALPHDKTIIGVWGRSDDGALDLRRIEAVSDLVPPRRTLVLLGDLPDDAAFSVLNGLVDAALVGVPILASDDPAAAIARFTT
jgi:indole-3-glycerol phosphate synthase